jgi:CheY-like chemotaxis protein
VADIKMPGNPELELVRDLPGITRGLPVILVTGYPSVRSATDSLQLPVVAYMVKPIDIAELRTHVERGVKQYRIYRSACLARDRLDDWRRQLRDVEELMSLPVNEASAVPIETFLDLNMHNILGALMDLRNLSAAMAGSQPAHGTCHLLNCPQVAALTAALSEAIEILRETKSSFKSRALGDLRRKLEDVVTARGDQGTAVTASPPAPRPPQP